LRALAHAVGEADEFLLAFRCGTDDDQDALGLVFEPRLQVDAIDPEIDIALGREIAPLPVFVLIRPNLFEAGNGRRRKPRCILADERRQHLLEVASRDALEVEDREQNLEALGAPRVGRQDRRAEPDTLTARNLTVTDARLSDGDRTNAGHDFARRQVAVSHHALPAVLGLETAVLDEKFSDLRLDGAGEKGLRPVAQDLSQLIDKGPWLGQLENATVGHGVSLLCWRSGGSNTPTIRRLTPSLRHQLSRIARSSHRCCHPSSPNRRQEASGFTR
jgi:hypothetical protein